MELTLTRSPHAGFWLGFTALSVVYLLFLFPSPEYSAYNKDDAGFFVTLGINLSSFGHYTVDTYPRADYGRHGTWPPGFPLMLAGVIRVCGLNWWVLKLVMVFLSLGNLMLLWYLFGSISPAPDNLRLAAWATLLTGLSPMYFLFGHMTMTEIPFMLCCTATLLQMVRSTSLLGAALAGVLATIAFFVRGYAVAFMPAGFIFYLAMANWPWPRRVTAAALFVVPLAVSIAGWSWYTQLVINGGHLDSITEHFGNGAGIVSDMGRPLGVYLRDVYWYHCRFFVHLLVPLISLPTALRHDALAGVGAIFIVVCILGWGSSVRRGEYAVSLWLACSIGLLLAGGVNGARYWLTFLPFIIFLALSFVRDMSLRWHRLGWLFPVAVIALLCSMGGGLVRHLQNPDELRFISPYWKEWQQVASWAQDSLPADAVVVTHSPHNAYPTLGRRAVFGPPGDPAEWPVADIAHEQNLYVLGPKRADDSATKTIRQMYEWIDDDERFDIVFDGECVRVWRVRWLSVQPSHDVSSTADGSSTVTYVRLTQRSTGPTLSWHRGPKAGAIAE